MKHESSRALFTRFSTIVCQRILTVFGLAVFLTASVIAVVAQDRIIRVGTMATSASVQSQVEIPIRLIALGDESAASFSLRFNPAVLTNPVVALGNDMPPGSSLVIKADNVAQGFLGIIVNSPFTFSAGTRKIVTATFTIPANIPASSNPILLVDSPTPRSVSSLTGEQLSAIYEQGIVVIGPENGVSLSGRVLTPDGRGLVNATVVATDSNGDRRLATTGPFGYYSFPYVQLAGTYTFTIQSKRYRFAPRVAQIFDLLTNFDFVGLQ